MIRRLFSSQLRINMISGVAATLVSIVVLAIAYPVYLHFLGYEKYGVWLVLATVLSFAQLGNLGIGQAIMKLMAEEYGRGNIEAIQQYVMTAIAILTTAGAAILLVILTFKAQIVSAFKLTGENAQMVLWLLPYIACLNIYVLIVQALNATLSGLGRMDLANWTQSAGRIVAVTTAGSLLYSGHGIESLLIGNALSYVFIHVASLIFIWRIAHIRFLRISNLSGQCCKRLLRFGLGLFGASVMNMLLSPFNKLMLARYAGISSIPIYEIAFNGSRQIKSLFQVGLRALMPEISRIGANMTSRARDRISRINRHAMRLIFLFGIPMYGGLLILLTPLLKLWLRHRFVGELPIAFRIMLIATFLSLISAPAFYTLLGLGRVRQCFFAYAIQTTTSFFVIVSVTVLGVRLSVTHVVWAVLAGMGIASVYVISQKYRVLRTVPCVPRAENDVFGLAEDTLET